MTEFKIEYNGLQFFFKKAKKDAEAIFQATVDGLMKDFFKRPRIAADFINSIILKGRGKVGPEDVRILDTEETKVMSDHGDLFTKERRRDILLEVKPKGEEPFILAIECQTTVDRKMGIRILDYDDMRYSNMMNRYGNIPMQIVPIVFYVGEDRWSASTSLGGMIKHIYDKELLNDWMYHLLDIRELNADDFEEQEWKDLITGIQLFYNSDGSDALKRINFKTSKYIAKLIAKITHCDELYEIIKKEEGDEIDMCSAMDTYTRNVEKRAEARGKTIGFAEGEARGNAKVRYLKAYIAIEKVIREYHCSLEKALEMTGMTMVEYMNGKRLSEI